MMGVEGAGRGRKQSAMDLEERRSRRISSAAPRCFRSSLCRVFASAGLLALVVGYCFLGAFLFQFLEEEFEVEQKKAIEKYRDDCIKELWQITEHLNVLYEKNWTLMVNERLQLFETNIAAATVADRQILMNEEKQWSYGGALFYSVAVITTIGFGSWTPETTAGKLMTMVYAIMGIPLMIVCLSYLGTLLAHALRFAYTAVCCFFFSCCFTRKEYAYKSQAALTSVSLEEADFTVDIEESIEDISAGHLIGNSENPLQIQILSNSYMLPTMDVNAVDVDPNTQMPSSNVSEDHELNCKIVEKDFSPTIDANVEIKNISSEQGEGYSANRNLCEKMVAKESFDCSEEEFNTQEDSEDCKGSKSKEPVTPSRVPLIGKSQAYEYPLSALAEAKNIWTSALSTRPPTPVPSKRGRERKKERLSKYASALNTFSESDRFKFDIGLFQYIRRSIQGLIVQYAPFQNIKMFNSYFLRKILSRFIHTSLKCSSLRYYCLICAFLLFLILLIPRIWKAARYKVPIFLVLGILCAYICIGGVAFSAMEGKSFIDGAYFCFVTLATIGFGEAHLGNSQEVENLARSSTAKTFASFTSASSSLNSFPVMIGESEQQLRLITSSLYLLLGLVLIASSIVLIQEEIIAYHQSIQEYFGITKENLVEEDCEEMDEFQEPLKEMSFS